MHDDLQRTPRINVDIGTYSISKGIFTFVDVIFFKVRFNSSGGRMSCLSDFLTKAVRDRLPSFKLAASKRTKPSIRNQQIGDGLFHSLLLNELTVPVQLAPEREGFRPILA